MVKNIFKYLPLGSGTQDKKGWKILVLPNLLISLLKYTLVTKFYYFFNYMKKNKVTNKKYEKRLLTQIYGSDLFQISSIQIYEWFFAYMV